MRLKVFFGAHPHHILLPRQGFFPCVGAGMIIIVLLLRDLPIFNRVRGTQLDGPVELLDRLI